jgi:hypothetical protein
MLFAAEFFFEIAEEISCFLSLRDVLMKLSHLAP